MIKSSCKNGITVEKDIELVMKNTGATPWYYYLLQFLFLSTLCASIAFCFFSGLEISVANGMVVLVLAVFVALFMVLFSFQSVLKYTGLLTLFLYVMFGYINLERLQEGSAQIYNTFIGLYNEYFNSSSAKIVVSHSEYRDTEQFFVLFIMFLIVAVVCYTAMFGKTMFFYILTTIPAVFLCFIIGYTPELWSYILYISGTLALFASVISERYGLFSKVNRRKRVSLTVMFLERTRVKIQMICAIILSCMIAIIYISYSPEKYEKEFDAKQVRTDLQDKIKSLTSSDLLKDTFFNKMADNIAEERGNSGLSNGRLGTIGKITYANKTALIVRTTATNKEGFYLKGYVGERYEGNRWTTLTKTDQREVRKLNESLSAISDVEQLPSQFSSVYQSSIYRYYPLSVYEMEVENKSADSSCDYVPYNYTMGYNLDNGKVKTGSTRYEYYYYEIPEIEPGLSYDEMFFKYCKFNSVLQLNTLNASIFSKYLGYELNFENMEQALSDIQKNEDFDVGYKLSEFDKSIKENQNKDVRVFTVDSSDPDMVLGDVIYMNNYAADENAYFNLVKDIYTKLPDTGLEQVKDLIKDKKVDLSLVDTKHTGYKTMDQVDSTEYARKVYDLYSSRDIDTQKLLSASFTYDERTKQDKIFDAIIYVKDYLAQNTSYTLSPGKTPSGEDYVEYFLFKNKKGYCMHYASAATVMLRAMGVPARYCEGYVVTEEDLSKGKTVNSDTSSDTLYQFGGNTEYVEADIKDTNAHAWVEVYLPGYGWAPIEMTAPYSNQGTLEIPPVNEDPKATLKPTVKPTVKPSATASIKPFPSAGQNETSKPQITSSPSGSTEQKSSVIENISSWYNGLSKSMKRLLKIVIGLIVFISLACILLIVRRKIVLKVYKKHLQTFSGSQIILYEYNLLSKLTAKSLPVYTTDSSYEAYAERFVEKYPFIEKEDATVYFAILLKAKFAMGEMTQQEVSKVMEFNNQFMMYQYNNGSKLKQWYYKYIFVLR
ncbi:MAG: transglutaminase-like domain-containing protein [bacterium]|nr:transglutaminase-like domain-containing protein [bacterium]